jgi:hypothetical protein
MNTLAGKKFYPCKFRLNTIQYGYVTGTEKTAFPPTARKAEGKYFAARKSIPSMPELRTNNAPSYGLQVMRIL